MDNVTQQTTLQEIKDTLKTVPVIGTITSVISNIVNIFDSGGQHHLNFDVRNNYAHRMQSLFESQFKSTGFSDDSIKEIVSNFYMACVNFISSYEHTEINTRVNILLPGFKDQFENNGNNNYDNYGWCIFYLTHCVLSDLTEESSIPVRLQEMQQFTNETINPLIKSYLPYSDTQNIANVSGSATVTAKPAQTSGVSGGMIAFLGLLGAFLYTVFGKKKG